MPSPGPRLTRARIVEAATAAVETSGHEAISMRVLARQIGVTAPALYDHVPSKDAILRSVAEAGYDALSADLAVEGDLAIDRVRGRAVAYVDFACRNPELFRLMFRYRPAEVEISDAAGEPVDNELDAASTAFAVGLSDLAQAVADGHLIDLDIHRIATLLWSATHGVATIGLLSAELAGSIVDDVIDAMIAGLAPAGGLDRTARTSREKAPADTE